MVSAWIQYSLANMSLHNRLSALIGGWQLFRGVGVDGACDDLMTSVS